MLARQSTILEMKKKKSKARLLKILSKHIARVGVFRPDSIISEATTC